MSSRHAVHPDAGGRRWRPTRVGRVEHCVARQVEGNIRKSPAHRPTAGVVGASWAALFAGTIAYDIGPWNAAMRLEEKGYSLTAPAYGLFSAVAVGKNVRDVEPLPDAPMT